MTVSTVVDHNDYTGNGVTTSFPYTFRIFKKSDLTVSVIDLIGTLTVLVLDTDYTVTNAGGYNGGSVVLTTPLTNGWQISIARELEPTQETDLRNQGKFFAEVHEDAFDKLTMLIQQAYSVFRLALRKPSSIANWYDALNNYIRNVKDPRDPQDAATKHYVDDNIGRTLRTPEIIPSLPDVAGRRNKIVAMDNNGNPYMVLPESGSAADVMIELAKPTGASHIGTDNGETVQERINDIITFQSSVDSESYSRRNIDLLSNADFKIRSKSSLKILFQGDSMTAGLDQKSTDSVPPENGDWARHASITYPERVVSFMSERAGVSVTPTIRAISGQTAKQGFIQSGWDVNPNCNIAVLMYGINDVASSTIDEYMEYMEKLIRRFIDWGMGVVVCSLSSGGFGATTQISQVWARRLKILSNLYGCAYFNAAEVAYQYFTGAATSDGGHFNSSGYSRHGEQLSSFLMGGGLSKEYTPVNQELVMWPGMISDKHGYYNPQNNLDLTLNYEYTLQGVSGIFPAGVACLISFSFYLDAEYAEVDCVGSWNSGGKMSVAVDSPVPVVSYYSYTNGTPSVRKYDAVRETSISSLVSAGMSDSGLPKRIAQLVGRGWKTISIFNALDSSSSSASKIQAVIVRPSLISKYGQSGGIGVGNVESVIAKLPPSNSSNPSTGGVPDPVALAAQVVLPLPFDLYGKVWDNNTSFFDCGMAKLKIKCIGGSQGTTYYEGLIIKDASGYNLKVIDLPNKVGTWPVISAKIVLKPETVLVAAGSVSTDMPLSDIRGPSTTTVTNSSTGNQYGLFVALNFDWSLAGGVAKTGYYEISLESPSTGTGATPVMATL